MKTFEEYRLNSAIQSKTIEKKVNKGLKEINSHQDKIGLIVSLLIMTFALQLTIFIYLTTIK